MTNAPPRVVLERSGNRMQARVPVMPANAAALFWGKSLNLSSMGMVFETEEAIALGTTLDVRLALEGHPRSIKASGIVVWVQPQPGARRWTVGLRFTLLSHEDWQTLMSYCPEGCAAGGALDPDGESRLQGR